MTPSNQNSRDDFDFLAFVIITVLVIILFISFISIVFYLYKRRVHENALREEALQSAFRQELLKAKNEIQEQTLAQISREIHDNITQVLSFVKLNMAVTGKTSAKEKELKLSESRSLIAQVITDLRDLSKSLSFEHIRQIGLVKTIEMETERINKSGIIKVATNVKGDIYSLGEERELVLFRVLQEALNNALKHSEAKTLKISLHYLKQIFNLTIEDNGVGFSPDTLAPGGSGLKNIVNRAALIGAVAKIVAAPGKGCCIKITIDLTQNKHADGNQNSTG